MELVIPTQYVEQGMFNQAIDRLDRAITDMHTKLDVATTKLEQAIEVVVTKNKDAIERERLEREAHIEKLQADADAKNQQTSEQLAGVYQKLDTMTNALGRLTGVIEGYGDKLHAREMIFEDSRNRIEKLETSHQTQENGIALITSTQSAMNVKLEAVTGAIWGDTSKPDASPSLNKMLANVDSKLQVVLETNKASAARLDLLEKAQQDENQKWARRKTAVVGMAQSLKGSSVFLVLLGIALVGVVVGIFPSTVTTISQIVELLFNQ